MIEHGERVFGVDTVDRLGRKTPVSRIGHHRLINQPERKLGTVNLRLKELVEKGYLIPKGHERIM